MSTGWDRQFDYSAYYRELELRRQEERRLEQQEQQEIDDMPTLTEEDLQRKQQRKRQRYKCGDDGYVELKDIPLWSTSVEELMLAKKIGAAYHASSSFGTPRITEIDQARRFQCDQELNTKVSLFRGDITSLEVDAIVNAANESLLGGGGIDGAIHDAAGPLLLDECRTLQGCQTGDTKITRGYKLPANHVLHTVGPVGRGDGYLVSCYSSCFRLLLENKLRSIALCCVGTGIYGFPLVRATHIALHTARTFLEAHSADIDRIIFCVFRHEELAVYEKLMPSYFPVDDASDMMSSNCSFCPDDKIMMFDPNDHRSKYVDDDESSEDIKKYMKPAAASSGVTGQSARVVGAGNDDVLPQMNTSDFEWSDSTKENTTTSTTDSEDMPIWFKRAKEAQQGQHHPVPSVEQRPREHGGQVTSYSSPPVVDDDDQSKFF